MSEERLVVVPGEVGTLLINGPIFKALSLFWIFNHLHYDVAWPQVWYRHWSVSMPVSCVILKAVCLGVDIKCFTYGSFDNEMMKFLLTQKTQTEFWHVWLVLKQTSSALPLINNNTKHVWIMHVNPEIISSCWHYLCRSYIDIAEPRRSTHLQNHRNASDLKQSHLVCSSPRSSIERYTVHKNWTSHHISNKYGGVARDLQVIIL